MDGDAATSADVVALLVAVERLVDAHRDELDALNVFPVPDADTGRNVLATVRAARAAAEQADPAARRSHAVTGALRGARGNAGVLSSQLLRALVADGGGGWAARLATADDLCRAAVAHPVEGSFLTAVRAAAEGAATVGDDDALRAATRAAHAAVRATPTQLEVLARAGVVDAGARAAALVLEAVTAHLGGTAPTPPTVEVPAGGPTGATCTSADEHFEVMYLLEPTTDTAADAVRDGLARVGSSVVVVAADRLVSVHVHTDDIGAAVDVGLAHGRPHNIRVEDLHEGARVAAAARGTGADTPAATGRDTGAGLVVVTDGDDIAQLAAATGATTVPLGDEPPAAADLRAAATRTGRANVLVLPGDPRVAGLATDLTATTGDGPTCTVVAAADGPARVLAALAVLDPAAPDAARLEEAAAAVTEDAVVPAGGAWEVASAPGTGHADPLRALEALLAARDAADVELVTLLCGHDVGVALRDAAATAIERRWPDAEVDVLDLRLRHATFVVGLE